MKNIALSLLILLLTSCGPNLQKTGIPTEGRVLSKRSLPVGSKTSYYITFGYFTQPDKENPAPEKKKDSTRSVDEIINDLGIKPMIGDYYSSELQISLSEYDTYQEGDYVNLKYEKGNPTNLIIAAE